MKLYKIEASNWETFFGTVETPIQRDVTIIAQTPSCNAFLLLAKDTFTELQLFNTVPTGFDFTYCQEWGLTINDAVVARVVLDIRKKSFPPMADYLDGIVKGDTAQVQKYIDDCLAVKAKYPKENNE